MRKPKEKNFTKFLTAIINIDDYEFLKTKSKNLNVSQGFLIRNIIKEYKEKEQLIKNN